ncbi:hypothetical protein [Bradyrhizobium sp. AUGA SZCCT0160]|uniref:hypothetical protein n=1 Tax=Bradyrhizobium sp. AUGA SZCCT0160 TaxID=2807662 RepID=UPI001BA55FAF|nr:hypothetical protein [Bradyrhizobium sp. AUGA SZCCT0160]MBR1187271.1 hypothetical protein [Bradyrhizobium sp. AUGA SZCCT0160]
MSNQASMLTESDLEAVSGGQDTTVRFKIFGIRISISTTDGPNGPITCTTVRGSDGKGSSTCTIPV